MLGFQWGLIKYSLWIFYMNINPTVTQLFICRKVLRQCGNKGRWQIPQRCRKWNKNSDLSLMRHLWYPWFILAACHSVSSWCFWLWELNIWKWNGSGQISKSNAKKCRYALRRCIAVTGWCQTTRAREGTVVGDQRFSLAGTETLHYFLTHISLDYCDF